jgi:hypothetical protein
MSDLHLLTIAALFLGILVIPLGPAATIDWPMSRPLQASQVNRVTLPFSFAQVVNYFDVAFEKPGHITRSYIREYVENNAVGEYTAIVVSSAGQKIRVALVTNGDWGVSYIREFFEAPFFLQSETEKLYTLLNAANPSARYAKVGRFDVQIEVSETPRSIVITAEFGPAGCYPSPRTP